MIVIIDNYDSFVFNIARYFQKLGEATEVIRNDAIGVGDLARLTPGAVVISPGPCTPMEAGISTAVVRELSGVVPILGICLGHQCIGSAFGGNVRRASRPMHGRSSSLAHDGQGLFDGLPSPLNVGRYHSLIVDLDDSCAPKLVVPARSEEGEIMALTHRDHPTYGIQFHPESILTQQGEEILKNFLRLSMNFGARGL
ncbi:aminodeoxychorismate/anthranilate synthase component II [Bradyrhizobium sp. NBAIM01]|uniref:anthranilate synthase component II n=1 Tax=Bradyrhizobium sp. NBAIM01 TaxID=2793818 RepID=UPI001CD6356C|nr:aminodeoxychorismate/anthranilate synthase component II [Bradyrhizobium sp. NBAIM01]MCA1510520.1 aminodeoxychorismate/anthranilate synthase component II [Bradyrhizobium sp. NBAIM01]